MPDLNPGFLRHCLRHATAGATYSEGQSEAVTWSEMVISNESVAATIIIRLLGLLDIKRPGITLNERSHSGSRERK